jgi:hypothetical protein
MTDWCYAILLFAILAIPPVSNAPSINLTCSSQPLNIPWDASRWDRAFSSGYVIWLTTTPGDPRLKSYKYTGSTDNAVVRMACDENRLYFLGEYVIPDKPDSISYKPSDFAVYVDTLDNKSMNRPLQKTDYRFDVVGSQPNEGVWYSNGTGYYLQGHVRWWPWARIDNTELGGMWVEGAHSIISTSIFKQPHPVFYFDLLKSFSYADFAVHNPFGLAFWISDQNVIANSGMYYFALFPKNNLGFDGGPVLPYNPLVWADVYSSFTNQTNPTSVSIKNLQASGSAALFLGIASVVGVALAVLAVLRYCFRTRKSGS